MSRKHLNRHPVGDDALSPVTRHLVVHTNLQRLEQSRLAYWCTNTATCPRTCPDSASGLQRLEQAWRAVEATSDYQGDLWTCLGHVADVSRKPPPTMRVTPRGSPIPVSEPAFGTGRVTRSEGGEEKGTAEAASIGRSLAPVARGSTDPSATKATSPRPA